MTNIGESSAFNANNQYLDKNRHTVGGKGVGFIDAYVDTNTIHLIETGNLNYYTLKIINNNPNQKDNIFYNLVFEHNIITGEVTSVILQYIIQSSSGYLTNPNLIKFDNQLISIEDLEDISILDGELRGSVNPCTISAEWVCTIQGHPDPIPGCTGGWVITIGPGCGGGGGGGSGEGGDGGSNGGENTGGGGGGGSGATQTLVLEICDGFTNTGDPGNSEDCEDDYAAYFIPYICEDYVDFALTNGINIWALGMIQMPKAIHYH